MFGCITACPRDHTTIPPCHTSLPPCHTSLPQVFEHVNHTLQCDDETRRRRLHIRTYKIVPTTPQTGVIEMVARVQAFGAFLTQESGGAHARYYPDDWSAKRCREEMTEKDAGTGRGVQHWTDEDRRDRLLEVFRHFSPAFRFFFLEKYPDPAQWMNCRLAYTRSVAVTSVVGYILGIGDRHAQNILVDTGTAEVVHIDFGIVFEQGKTLGTPETVPFRLTRDIVDGMGITGCEGTFRRSCEEVLRVLRGHQQSLLTILEVVIHDPLYKWSLSPVAATRIRQQQADQQPLAGAEPQATWATVATGATGRTSKTKGARGAPALHDEGARDREDEEGEGDISFQRDAADRTLARIRSKLQGIEDPTSGALGVEGQVELIVTEARNVDNLCRLFPGWAPWL